jgi:hypothetical protein
MQDIATDPGNRISFVDHISSYQPTRDRLRILIKVCLYLPREFAVVLIDTQIFRITFSVKSLS